MEYCCHIWAGASQRSLSTLDSVQKRLLGLVGPDLYSTLQPLSHRPNVASISLFYRYFHGKCSHELHSVVPPLRVSNVKLVTPMTVLNILTFSKSLSLTTNFTRPAFFLALLNYGTLCHHMPFLTNTTFPLSNAMQTKFSFQPINYFLLFLNLFINSFILYILY